jgi:hypothetical protein
MAGRVVGAWFLILKAEISYTSVIWHWMFFSASWIWGLSFIYLNPEYLVMPWDFITFGIMLSLGTIISLYIWVQKFSLVLNLKLITLQEDVL